MRVASPVSVVLTVLGVVVAAVAGPAAAGEPVFHDAAAELGLEFRHFNGMTGEFLFPEMTGQGGAFFDYDDDGDLDVYLVQGGLLSPGKTLADAIAPPPAGTPPGDRLFRNDLGAGPGGAPRFVDVTARSGLAANGYGMGVATGDVDNDGWVDLYVTNYGANELWINRGDGTFVEETEVRGVADSSWSTSAAFADLDADGWLDLYVVNYVDFDVVRNPTCYATSTRRDYCGPSAFPPLSDRLFLNRGDGRFAEATSQRLASYRSGPGLGVAAADFDGDGRMDLFVANDGAENQLWRQRADGTFADDSLFAGVAVNRQGRPEASMGVAVGDFDLDGDFDLFLTHLMGETNTLYLNDGGLFEDRTLESGLAAPSSPYTAFGTLPVDFDNDGDEDLLAVNGAVRILEAQAAAGDPYPLKQPNQLFENRGGRFVEVGPMAGPSFAIPEVSRGAAAGDVDNDGDVDVLLLNNNGPARLLLNHATSPSPSPSPSPSRWTGWDVRSPSGRPAIGARVVTRPAAGPALHRRVATDGSYCAANDPRTLAGLGSSDNVHEVDVIWPDGKTTRFLQPPTASYYVHHRPLP